MSENLWWRWKRADVNQELKKEFFLDVLNGKLKPLFIYRYKQWISVWELKHQAVIFAHVGSIALTRP